MSPPEKDAVIHLQRLQKLYLFPLDLPDLQPAPDIIIKSICFFCGDLQQQLSVLIIYQRQDAAHILCEKDAHDLQLFLDPGRKTCKIFIQIILLFICICSTEHHSFLIHFLHLYTYPYSPRTDTSPA